MSLTKMHKIDYDTTKGQPTSSCGYCRCSQYSIGSHWLWLWATVCYWCL